MSHVTLYIRPHIYRGYKCDTTVTPATQYSNICHTCVTPLNPTRKGIEPSVTCVTFVKTMELFKYCLKNNIGLKLPDMAEPGQTNEVTFPEKKEVWNIAPLVEYFSTCCIPTGPVKLDRCTTVFNPLLFAGTHLATIKAHNGNPVYRPYFDRLVTFQKILESINLNYIKQ